MATLLPLSFGDPLTPPSRAAANRWNIPVPEELAPADVSGLGPGKLR